LSADLYFTTDSYIFTYIFTTDSSFFFFLLLSSFFVSYPPRSLDGSQPKLVTCSEVSAIAKCMSEIWGTSSRYKSGAQNHLFSTTSQLNGKFNGLYLPNETRYKQAVSALATRRGLLHHLKTTWTLVHKRLLLRLRRY